MPHVRLELDQRTYDALIGAAVRERRPVPWHAEVIIRRFLGTHTDESMPARLSDGGDTGFAPRRASQPVKHDDCATGVEHQ
jgi:hypothetical protein